MKHKYIVSAFVLLGLCACQKEGVDTPISSDDGIEAQKIILRTMLAGRDTRWTEEDLAIPQENAGWKEVKTAGELAFLLEFGSTGGEKYRLVNSIDVSASSIADKFAAEIGVEKFENFEFDGSGNTISGMNLPLAAGLFSRVNCAVISNLTLSDCIIGSDDNMSNLIGTGSLMGSAAGEVKVTGVTVNRGTVSAPCKVGGFVGAVTDATCTFTNCNVTDTNVKTLYYKGVSGWCGGFVGFVGRSEEKSGSVNVTVTAETCNVSGGKVQAHMESDTRYSGTFLGTLNGYDYNEVFSMNNCTVSTTFEGLDSKASSFVSIFPDRKVGGHKYMEGYVCFDGVNYAVPWDGTTETKPALVDGAYKVYTAAELAWFRGKTETTNRIHICRDIDLGGHVFAPIKEAKYVDGQKKDGSNSEIRNLKINFKHVGKSDGYDKNGYGGAFINWANSNGTEHKNLDFIGADVYVSHCDQYPDDLSESGQYGNGYAATLCSRINSGTYTVSNIHCYDGKIDGVCKMGGLLGGSWATLTVDNCSVENYYIQNHEANCINKYYKEAASGAVTCEAEFYTEGECGGLIGFICKNSTVSNCSVNNTKIRCYGQKDQNVSFGGSLGGWLGTMLIPGRHVNQFIGDIRTQSSDENNPVTIDLVEPVVSGNIYVGSGYMYDKKNDNTELSADDSRATTYDYNHSWSSASTPYIGCAYYVGASVLSAHMGDYAGTVSVTKNGTETAVTVVGGRN